MWTTSATLFHTQFDNLSFGETNQATGDFRQVFVKTLSTGVELEGEPAPPTRENIAAVMELYPVGERSFQEFTLRQVLLNAAKNGCGPSAAGTSSRAEGPNTAEPAEMTACPAPEARVEPTGGSAPTASTP